MASISHPIALLGKTSAVLLVGQLVSSTAYAQLTSSAAQSPDSESHNGYYVWYITFAVAGAGAGALLLWWRQKTKAKLKKSKSRRTANNKFGDTGVATQKSNSQIKNSATLKQKLASQKIAAAPTAERTEVFAKTSVRAASSFATPSNAAEMGIHEAVLATADVADNETSSVVPQFKMPDPVDSLVPLPSSDDKVLLEAAQQAVDFDANEEERQIALLTLSIYVTENSVETLSQVALYDESSRLRASAVGILADFKHESVFEPVLLACADISREVRAAAARALSKLEFDRAKAFARIVESNDAERQRLAAMACVDAGLVNHAFARLVHSDRKQATEAFAIVRLLVAANEIQPIIGAIKTHADLQVRLATIQILKTLESDRVLLALEDITANEKLPANVRQAVNELIDQLSKA